MNEEVSKLEKKEMSLLRANVFTFISAFILVMFFSFIVGFITTFVLNGLGIGFTTRFLFDVLDDAKEYSLYVAYYIVMEAVIIFCTMHFAIKDQFRKRYLSEENLKRYKISTLTLFVIILAIDYIAFYGNFQPFLEVFRKYQAEEMTTTIFTILFGLYYVVELVAYYLIYRHTMKIAEKRCIVNNQQ